MFTCVLFMASRFLTFLFMIYIFILTMLLCLKDERYAKYVGCQAIVPMTYGRHIPIIGDRVRASPVFICLYIPKTFGSNVILPY